MDKLKIGKEKKEKNMKMNNEKKKKNTVMNVNKNVWENRAKN